MFFPLAVLVAASAMVASAFPIINNERAGSYESTFDVEITPTNIGACDHVTIGWIGDDNGLAPWTLEIGIGGYYVNGLEIIQTIDNLCDDTYSWTVTTPPGTSMFFRVTSSDGKVSYTQNHVVQDTGFCSTDSDSATDDEWTEEPSDTATATDTMAGTTAWDGMECMTVYSEGAETTATATAAEWA